MNFCGVFTGVLYVYGKHQNGEEASSAIMSYIYEVLNTLEPRDLHSELMVLSSVDKFSIIEGDNINRSSSDGQLSRLGTLLIIISGLITVSIIYYIYIQRKERRLFDTTSSVDGILEGKHHSGGLAKNVRTKTKESGDGGQFIDQDLNFEPFRDRRESRGVLL